MGPVDHELERMPEVIRTGHFMHQNAKVDCFTFYQPKYGVIVNCGIAENTRCDWDVMSDNSVSLMP